GTETGEIQAFKWKAKNEEEQGPANRSGNTLGPNHAVDGPVGETGAEDSFIDNFGFDNSIHGLSRLQHAKWYQAVLATFDHAYIWVFFPGRKQPFILSLRKVLIPWISLPE